MLLAYDTYVVAELALQINHRKTHKLSSKLDHYRNYRNAKRNPVITQTSKHAFVVAELALQINHRRTHKLSSKLDHYRNA